MSCKDDVLDAIEVAKDMKKMPPEILDYLNQVEEGPWRVCPEQVKMAQLVRRCFETEDIYVDTKQLANYLKLEKYFPFELFPWEKFLIAIWDCTYWRETGLPRWPTLFCLLGRGSGKDGFISFDAFCSVSPYCESTRYDVDICANLEEQAMRPLIDLVDALERPTGKARKILDKHYYHTKVKVQGRKNGGSIQGRTNNPKSRDGMRTGKAVFNEIHQYQDYANITVFRTGQGKVPHPRTGYFTSNGNIFDGPLDDLLDRAKRILNDGEADNGFFPFICRLHSKNEIHDPDNWYMANPSLQYMPHLLQETQDEYEEWKVAPEQNPDFPTKRMGLRSTAAEIVVTDYDNLEYTKGELPDMTGWPCVVGIDYAELSDWAAVNLHFRYGDKRFEINHAWVCTHSKTLHRVKAPWQSWAKEGHITVVDEVTIAPELLTNWIGEMAKTYYIKGLAMDNFRWTLMSDSLLKLGFDPVNKKNVKLVRPSDIMKVDPVIQDCFDRHLFSWGKSPHLRWAVNNTKRVRSSRAQGSDTGNYYYAKIEGKSRKTDPFMALVASMTIEPLLGAGAVPLKELPGVIVV